jgi:hypothetical protein
MGGYYGNGLLGGVHMEPKMAWIVEDALEGNTDCVFATHLGAVVDAYLEKYPLAQKEDLEIRRMPEWDAYEFPDEIPESAWLLAGYGAECAYCGRWVWSPEEAVITGGMVLCEDCACECDDDEEDY